MSGPEVARWLVIFACTFNVGAMGALFGRVGRFFLPSGRMRLLMAGNVLVMVGVALIIGSHLNQPIGWRHLLLAAGAFLQLAALVGLWWWYGTETGRSHARRVMYVDAPPPPATIEDPTEHLVRRVRHLGFWTFALYTIALLVGLVVLLVVVRMHTALCAYHGDLGDRAAAGQASLDRNRDYVFGNKAKHLPPHPGVIFGLSHAQVLANLAAQQKTIDNERHAFRSLSGLYC